MTRGFLSRGFLSRRREAQPGRWKSTKWVRSLRIAALSTLLAACGGVPAEQPAAQNDVVVTVRVADAEEYHIRLIDANDIATARMLLAGETAPAIPNGMVVRGDADVNVGYSWHIDPASVEFADTATEVCDGRPSDVEKHVITSDRYCPWSAKVVAITPAQQH